jgi:peptide/nickel transport system ATP-binding protein
MSGVVDPSGAAPLLELKAVSKRFVRKRDFFARIAHLVGAGAGEEVVQAVDRLNLAIGEDEVVGLVGESGCGKSTLARLAVGLLPPSAGERYWRGQRCSENSASADREQQLKMQMIFQDPGAALNPRLRVVDIVGEAAVAHRVIAPRQKIEYVGLQLNRVGIDPTLMRRRPHQFSAGQRARIGIARALAVRPELLVCDEPVATLDVSIQAQVLNLLLDLRAALGLSYLFISRDPGSVRHVSDRVAIMYLGRIVESGPASELFAAPNHPYTQLLLAAAGRLEPKKRSFQPSSGEIPSPLAPPAGCHFHPRCPHAMPRCKATAPRFEEIAPGRWSACYLNDAAG